MSYKINHSTQYYKTQVIQANFPAALKFFRFPIYICIYPEVRKRKSWREKGTHTRLRHSHASPLIKTQLHISRNRPTARTYALADLTQDLPSHFAAQLAKTVDKLDQMLKQSALSTIQPTYNAPSLIHKTLLQIVMNLREINDRNGIFRKDTTLINLFKICNEFIY